MNSEETRLLEKISETLMSGDFSLLLYSLCYDNIIRHSAEGNNIVFFTFSSPRELLSLLENGKMLDRVDIQYVDRETACEKVLDDKNQKSMFVLF